nr:MAG TPA: hypothetical protein [Caudoviricetes sp.]
MTITTRAVGALTTPHGTELYLQIEQAQKMPATILFGEPSRLRLC